MNLFKNINRIIIKNILKKILKNITRNLSFINNNKKKKIIKLNKIQLIIKKIKIKKLLNNKQPKLLNNNNRQSIKKMIKIKKNKIQFKKKKKLMT